MTSPSESYIESSERLKTILEEVDLGGLRYKPMISEKHKAEFHKVSRGLSEKMVIVRPGVNTVVRPVNQLADLVVFYDGRKRVGEIYFTTEPVKIKTLGDTFKQVAEKLREAYHLNQ